MTGLPIAFSDDKILHDTSLRECGVATPERPSALFGIGTVRGPIVNMPQGARYRIRLRQDDFATVYVKDGDTFTQWVLCKNVDGALCLGYQQQANIRGSA